MHIQIYEIFNLGIVCYSQKGGLNAYTIDWASWILEINVTW
jgi:hypothetical protein